MFFLSLIQTLSQLQEPTILCTLPSTLPNTTMMTQGLPSSSSHGAHIIHNNVELGRISFQQYLEMEPRDGVPRVVYQTFMLIQKGREMLLLFERA